MPIGSPQWMYASGADDLTIDQSLRFNDDDSAYLSRTPASAGNRKTWTWSGWVKLSEIGVRNILFSTYPTYHTIRFEADHLDIYRYSGGYTFRLKTTAVYRDTSAWYHIVVAQDTTQSTASNRLKLYVNGEQITDFDTETYPSQDSEFQINDANLHTLGCQFNANDAIDYYDGYLGEVNFIDGQALGPEKFGRTGDYGEWLALEYNGSYGTNGFRLPFKQDYTVEGFSAVTYNGNGTAGHYIGGTGFKPDFVWIKARDNDSSQAIFDSVRGVGKELAADSTAAEDVSVAAYLQTFENDGFTLGTDSVVNYSDGRKYVAWNWDMGSSNASNTSGTITSTVRANPTYGQSIVSWTGSGATGSVGHGLNSAPELVIIKNRDDSGFKWPVHLHNVIGGTGNHRGALNETGAFGSVSYDHTSSIVNLPGHTDTNKSSTAMIMYCFHSVTGYSKIGSYTGNGSANHAITGLGFKPAFLLIKRTNSAHDWVVVDDVRNYQGNQTPSSLLANTSAAETNQNGDDVTSLDSDGFKVGVNARVNGNNDTFIYMAFADKREYAYWLDQSGNNNDWTSNNLTESDISVDSPTNNFATWNPLDEAINGLVYSEGNLKASPASGNNHLRTNPTMFASSGKWYAEIVVVSGYISDSVWIGAIKQSAIHRTSNNDALWYTNDGAVAYDVGGEVKADTVSVSTGGTTWTTNDVMSVALDMDNNKLYLGKNGTWFNSANFTNGTGYIYNAGVLADGSWGFSFNGYGSSGNETTWVANFGQDSSFAGAKTAQGNQDGNDIGDFYYTPPTGFLALCTSNLPAVAVIPSKHFNALVYAGNASNGHAITGVGFQPDFVWGKTRTGTYNHFLVDAVRGNTKYLRSDTTGAENTYTDVLTSFDSDGFTLGAAGKMNESGHSHISWNWKANGSGSSNTNGDVTSTVSANVDAGFSIVTYTGNGNNIDVGHGLSKAPDIVIVKERSSTGGWYANVKNIPSQSAGTDMVAVLNENYAIDGYNVGQWYFGGQAPTSSVFRVQNKDDVGANGSTYVAYCFHSVDGYSSIGSYTGNGNADGTFVYTGFRPAYVMVKRTNTAENWGVWDNKRDGYNLTKKFLIPSLSNAEQDGSQSLDLTSNGFKWRTGDAINNASSDSYIFLAFAETPFKYSNAR